MQNVTDLVGRDVTNYALTGSRFYETNFYDLD